MLGMGRCGSNLVRTALRSHPSLAVFNELYNRSQDRVDWSHLGFRSNEDDMHLREAAPVEFLERRVFRPMWPGLRAVGFKLFYDHVPDDSPLWRALERQPLRVIHLKRRDLLEAYASLTVAEKTGEWIRPIHREAVTPPTQIELEYESCLAYFGQAVAWREEFDRRFPQALEVFYEDLVTDFDGQMHDIQCYLGVRPRRLQPTTRKQNRRPLQTLIANYRELQAGFRGSRWEHLFDR